MDVSTINIFSTPVWGFILSSEHYHSLDYIDLITELADTQPSVSKNNFHSWQSNDNLHQEGIFRELVLQLNDIANQILAPYDLSGQVKNMWANVDHKHSYNAHRVRSEILSGAFYLKVPKNSGQLILVNPAVRGYNNPLQSKNCEIVPERLALILFPSWLEHYIEPNLNDEPRISISFNIG